MLSLSELLNVFGVVAELVVVGAVVAGLIGWGWAEMARRSSEKSYAELWGPNAPHTAAEILAAEGKSTR